MSTCLPCSGSFTSASMRSLSPVISRPTVPFPTVPVMASSSLSHPVTIPEPAMFSSLIWASLAAGRCSSTFCCASAGAASARAVMSMDAQTFLIVVDPPSSSNRSGQSGRLPQEIDLSLIGRRDHVTQARVCGIAPEGGTALGDRLVDDLDVLLDYGQRPRR